MNPSKCWICSTGKVRLEEETEDGSGRKIFRFRCVRCKAYYKIKLERKDEYDQRSDEFQKRSDAPDVG